MLIVLEIIHMCRAYSHGSLRPTGLMFGINGASAVKAVNAIQQLSRRAF